MGPRDTWKAYDTDANRHLTGYLMTHAKRLFADSVYDPGKRQMVIGPVSRQNERILHAFRDAWADDMRAGPVPEDGGVAWWDDCMQRAEAEIVNQLGKPAPVASDAR